MGFYIPDNIEEQKRRQIWALSATDRGDVPFVRLMGVSDGIDSPISSAAAIAGVQRAIEQYAPDVKIKKISRGGNSIDGIFEWNIDFF